MSAPLLSEPRTILIVMGVTGVGKSTFIQRATGLDIEIGHGLESCTGEISLYQIPDTNVYLVDTPGFGDTHQSDVTVLGRISQALAGAFDRKEKIAGVLYVHPITEPRMNGSAMKDLRMFQKVVGMSNMSNCRLVTTKWSDQSIAVSEARETEIAEMPQFWKLFLDAGAKMARFDNTMESAIEIIKPLVFSDPIVPHLTKQMEFDKLSLPQTDAGAEVNDAIEEATKFYKKEMEEYRDEYTWRIENAEQKRVLRNETYQKLEELNKAHEQLNDDRNSGRAARWIVRTVTAGLGTVAGIASEAVPAPAAAALLYAGIETSAQVHKATR